MGVSDIFDVAQWYTEGLHNKHTKSTVGSTAKRQRIRRNTWSQSCVVDPVESCGKGWDLISCDTKTSATVIHLEHEPLSTFRCKNPVVAAVVAASSASSASASSSSSSSDRLVQGSFYFKQRLAYFEVEILRMNGTCTIGWASQHHPMSNIEVGTTTSSVGYRNDGKMLSTETLQGGVPLLSEGEQDDGREDGGPSGHSWLLEKQEQEYTETDVIGCGLDCQTGCVFFTKNGNLLSLPFSLELNQAEEDGSSASTKQESIWPVVSASGQVKLQMRMQSRLKFDGFHEVLESLEKRPSSIRHRDRSSLRTKSEEEIETQERLRQQKRKERKERRHKEKRHKEKRLAKPENKEKKNKRNTKPPKQRLSLPNTSENPEEMDKDSSETIAMANPPRPPQPPGTVQTTQPLAPPTPAVANVVLKASQRRSSSVSPNATPLQTPSTTAGAGAGVDAAAANPIPNANPTTNATTNATTANTSTTTCTDATPLQKTVSSWTTSDVSDWLSSYDGNLSRYTSNFANVGVDGDMLIQMNDEDLKEDLNVKIRLHRVKILNERNRLVLAENLLRGGPANAGGRAVSSVNTWSSPSQSQKSSSMHRYNSSNHSGGSNSFHVFSRSSSKLTRDDSIDSGSSFMSSASSSGHDAPDHNIGGTNITDLMATTHLANNNNNRYNYPPPHHHHPPPPPLPPPQQQQQRNNMYATDIFALFSSPLVDGSRKPINKLAHEKEMQIMCTALRKAGKRISLTMSHATTDAMCTAVTLGCQVLHYSGHADQSSLAFEDANGRLHRLDIDRLGDLFGRRVGSSKKTIDVVETTATATATASGQKTTAATPCPSGFPPLPTLVFVSACHSEEAGNAFLRAGAELVVAVEIDSKLEDLAAHAFTRAFYLALATGNSVESSYHIGQAAVQAAPGRSKEAATSEAKKFKLMGRGYEKKIFSYVNQGDTQHYSNSSEEGVNEFIEPLSLIRDVIPVVPEGFVGRRVEMYAIIKQLKLHRTVSIVGEQGMGKSVVAIAAANYMSARNMYRDGIFYVKCSHDDDVESLNRRLLQQWFDRDLRSSERERHRRYNMGGGGSGGGGGGGRRRGVSQYKGDHFQLFGDDGGGGGGGGVGHEQKDYHSHNNNGTAESQLLKRLRHQNCLCVLDQASGAVGMFVQTIVERTSGVRFLLTTTQRSLADEHSVALHGLTPESAVRMFIRRCPRENLKTNEIPRIQNASVSAGDMMGRLRCALKEANVLSPGKVMRVCARMRDPNGLTLVESLAIEVKHQKEHDT